MKKIRYLDMVRGLLSESEFLEFEQCYTRPIQKSLHPIFSRIDFELFQEVLLCDGWKLKLPKLSYQGRVYGDVLFVEKGDKQSLGSHWMHQAGLFYVQEMAAGMSAQVLMGVRTKDRDERKKMKDSRKKDKDSSEQGVVVLDMCAAPWGKSVQLADGMKILGKRIKEKDEGIVIANEPNPQRRKALRANLERCGLENVVVTGYDGRELGEVLYEQCDKVLLDAPCSWEGMQYKSDFKVYGWNEKAVRKLAILQQELLISGLKALKVWGELVCSTCTTNVIENEGVVEEVLERLGGSVELVEIELDEKRGGGKVARLWPHVHGTGGFFMAKFRKKETLGKRTKDKGEDKDPRKKIQDSRPSNPPVASLLPPFWRGVCKGITDYLEEGFGLVESDFCDYEFLRSEFTIQAVSRGFVRVEGLSLRFEQVGLPILKVLKDGNFVPLVWLSQLFGARVRKNFLDVDDEQVKLLMQKADFRDERLVGFEGQYVVLRWRGIWVGVRKIKGERLKVKDVGKNLEIKGKSWKIKEGLCLQVFWRVCFSKLVLIFENFFVQ